MNRLAMLAATGLLAVLLTGCGESGTPKPADTTATQQTQGGASDAKPATDGQSQQ